MIRPLMCAALALFLAGRTAAAQDAAPSQADVARTSVRLNEVLVDLPAGTPIVHMTSGFFCVAKSITGVWPGGRSVSHQLAAYRAIFKKEMEAAGYKVVTPGENLFDPDAGAVDYEVAGVITKLGVEGCFSRVGTLETGIAKGKAAMKIDWQIFSPLTKQVVARVSTGGEGALDQQTMGGLLKIEEIAFTNNMDQLVEDPKIRAVLGARPQIVGGLQVPGRQSKIALAGSLKLGPRKIADATGSVVTIINSTGSGTGFLVSTDGYVLTDAHVVGDDKTVRIRWSDGLAGLGTVERVSKNRDVALIKTDARGRTPLAIDRGSITPGQRVYAIGSPKGEDFEGTVTAGIISADRTSITGLRYIQSDVMVSHGSSGGPLLDEKGAVIGLTDLGISNAGPTGEEDVAGLNLFTPIGDAMDFLALERK